MMNKYLFTLIVLFPLGLSSQSIDKKALDVLVERAKETHSSALVIYHDEELILNQCFDDNYTPLDAMSATKSFVNLAVGLLLTHGKINSIDEPVHRFYPAWNKGIKKDVTIRHLLNHTSGIQSQRYTSEIYSSPDYVKLALDADITDKPGSQFFYNNKAVNLLAGIIEKASGMRMDKYIHQYIFKPLEIQNYTWLTDAFFFNSRGKYDSAFLEKGNPICMAELIIKADDMAKVGLLVLHKGNWKGMQIIDESWFDESMKPGQSYEPTCGLLWWLVYDPAISYLTFDDHNIQKLQQVGIEDTLINDLKKVAGRYQNDIDFWNTIDTLESVKEMGGWTRLRDLLFNKSYFDNIYTFVPNDASIVGLAARGYLGQRMTIFPQKKLVVVRTISTRNARSPDDSFYDFDILAYQLVK
jgi:CubicO group peptidase (beta-lactamase class C family)